MQPSKVHHAGYLTSCWLPTPPQKFLYLCVYHFAALLHNQQASRPLTKVRRWHAKEMHAIRLADASEVAAALNDGNVDVAVKLLATLR